MEDTTAEVSKFESPYHEAWDYIRHYRCGGSGRLAKLVLSLYNEYDYSFSVTECLNSQDSILTRLSLDMIAHYVNHGETRALRDIGEKTKKRYPNLVALGEAIHNARNVFENKR